MVRVAIVDDDDRIIVLLTKILKKYFGTEHYIQEEYSNGAEFVRGMEDFHPGIVFMDIEMQRMNGEEAVRRLREKDIHENIYVIYISSHEDHLAPLFALHPFGFLVKPFTEEDVMGILDRIRRRAEELQKTISFVTERKEIIIPVSDVEWIQSLAHRLEIKLCTKEDPIYSYGKLNEVCQRLEAVSRDFLRIHASYVVNRRFITKYTPKAVYVGKNEFPVSAKYKADVMMKIYEGS